MAINVVLRSPAGVQGTIDGGPGRNFTIGADGSVTVPAAMAGELLKAGYTYFFTETWSTFVQSPIVAELVSIVAATIPVSGTPYTIAGQPDVPRKLQVRCVQSGAVANLVLNLVGTDGRGNAVSESVNVAGASTATFQTANAYSHVTSATPVGTVTNVTTLGVGVGTALALNLPPTFLDLVVFKESVAATGTAVMADETVGTVDTVAGTVIPTSVPNAAKNLAFWATCARASQ